MTSASDRATTPLKLLNWRKWTFSKKEIVQCPSVTVCVPSTTRCITIQESAMTVAEVEKTRVDACIHLRQMGVVLTMYDVCVSVHDILGRISPSALLWCYIIDYIKHAR